MGDEKTPGKGPNTRAQETEFDRLGIDPQLDNRVGHQRPHLDERVKPQQIHGGLPGDETDFEDPPSKDAVKGGEPLGMRSEGPHGRGPQAGPSSED
jgi:hypothetical protein